MANEIPGNNHLAEIWDYIHRTEMRQLLFDRVTDLVPDQPRCECDFLAYRISAQTFWRFIDEDGRDKADCREAEIGNLASLEGWTTLRGAGGRRMQIEAQHPFSQSGRGRPRRVFLVEEDRDWAERFLAHVRIEGLPHLNERVRSQIVLEAKPRADDVVYNPSFCAAPVHPKVQAAIALAESACALSERGFKRRRKRLAAELLAALGDCSVETTRKPLPTQEDFKISQRDPDSRKLDAHQRRKAARKTKGEIVDAQEIQTRLTRAQLEELAAKTGRTVEQLLNANSFSFPPLDS